MDYHQPRSYSGTQHAPFSQPVTNTINETGKKSLNHWMRGRERRWKMQIQGTTKMRKIFQSWISEPRSESRTTLLNAGTKLESSSKRLQIASTSWRCQAEGPLFETVDSCDQSSHPKRRLEPRQRRFDSIRKSKSKRLNRDQSGMPGSRKRYRD